MTTYIVFQMANLPRSDMSGYHQWFKAMDNDGNVAATVVSIAVPGAPQIAERDIVVNQREIMAATGYAAIAAYERWLAGQE